MSQEQIIEILTSSFYNYFDVESKNVIKFEIANNNLYSELNNNIKNNYVYRAKLTNGYEKYFLNESDAFRFVFSQSDFKVYEYNITNQIFDYNGQIFQSKEEFISFILNSSNNELKQKSIKEEVK